MSALLALAFGTAWVAGGLLVGTVWLTDGSKYPYDPKTGITYALPLAMWWFLTGLPACLCGAAGVISAHYSASPRLSGALAATGLVAGLLGPLALVLL